MNASKRMATLGIASVMALTVSAAGATTLTTGLINGGSGPGSMLCTAVNASTKTVDVELEAVSPVGDRLLGASGDIPPGHALAVGPTENVGFCRFIFKGSKNAIRGTGWVAIAGECTSYLQAY
jgi:hypothetical protein